MIINRTSSYLVLSDCPIALLNELSYAQRQRPTRFDLRKKNYKPKFDSVPIYTQANNNIITQPGIFDRVVRWCKVHGVSYTIKGIRVALPRYFDTCFDQLRDYQIDAVGELLSAGYGRAELPTGSGKTHILRAIHLAYRTPTLILVPSRDLLMQTAKFFEDYNTPFGIVGAGYYAPAPTVISTYKSAGQLDIAKFKVIIMDEVHHAGSSTLVDLFISARTIHRFGLSGTVEGRSDNSELLMESLLGPIRYKADYTELRKQGYLAELECYFVDIDEQPGYAMCREYSRLEKGCIVNNPRRNDLIIRMIQSIPDDEQLMVFCRQLKHMEMLSQCTGLEVIHGKMKMPARKRMLARLVSGELRKVITTPVYTEGMNIPGLSVIISAAGGKGRIPILQRSGRGSRVQGEKSKCTYIDFYDMGPPILERQSRTRMSLLRKQGHTLKRINSLSNIPVCKNADSCNTLAALDVGRI